MTKPKLLLHWQPTEAQVLIINEIGKQNKKSTRNVFKWKQSKLREWLVPQKQELRWCRQVTRCLQLQSKFQSLQHLEEELINWKASIPGNVDGSVTTEQSLITAKGQSVPRRALNHTYRRGSEWGAAEWSAAVPHWAAGRRGTASLSDHFCPTPSCDNEAFQHPL